MYPLAKFPNPLKIFLFVAVLFFIFCCGSSPTQEAAKPTLEPTYTSTQSATSPAQPSDTPVPPTNTTVPPTNTPVPPTATEAQPTDTTIPPTDTPVPPTATAAQPTATPSQVPTQPPLAQVVIVNVFNSGYQEHVEIVNQGTAPQNLGGWSVSGSKGDETFRFSDGYILETGATVRLHSGKNGVDAPPADIYWTDKTVWNNDGETVYLRDAQGNLVDEYKY